MNRRSALYLGMGTGVAALIGVAAFGRFGGAGQADEQATTSPAASVEIKRETLVEYAMLEGAVGYADPWVVASPATGVVTWLPAAGTVVARGRPVLRINDEPVVLFYGTLPMYRPLTVGDKGNDVAQLEANLNALGYRGLTVDKEFTASTGTAVKRWQKDLGVPETGVVDPGRIVLAGDSLRIAAPLVRLGAAVPADVLSVTGTTRVVTAQTESVSAAWAVPGAPVLITLPSGATVPGSVSTVTPQQEQNGGGTPKVDITIAVAEQSALDGVDRGVLNVKHVVKEKKDVLTVPVAALLALAEGGYGLEVVQDNGSHIVAVQAGMFASGRVEVSGAQLAPGTLVRVPQ